MRTCQLVEVMRYYAAGETSDLADRVLETSPILEAFGNAKTVPSGIH